MLKCLYFCCILAIISPGCQKNSPTSAPVVQPPDTTKNTQAPGPVDSAMMIYVGRARSLYAVNAQTGVVKWSLNLQDLVVNSPLYYQGMVYISTGYFRNVTLHAVDTNGKEQWSAILDPTTIGPMDVFAGNGLVYAKSENTPPSAYDAKTGAVRWTYPLAGLYSGGAGNILLNNGVLYFVNYSSVYAIDPVTGTKIWSIDDQTSILPAVIGNKVITAALGTVKAFDRLTAAPLWQQTVRQLDDLYNRAFSITTAMGNAYVYQGKFLDVIDTATGSIKFTIDMTDYFYDAARTITISDSLLFVSSIFLGIHCYNAVTGAHLYNYKPTPQAIDNYLYGDPLTSGVTCLNNEMFINCDLLYAVNASTRQTIWATLLENNDKVSNSIPCVVTQSGKVYRGEGYIY